METHFSESEKECSRQTINVNIRCKNPISISRCFVLNCGLVLAKGGASNRFSGNLHHLMKLALEIDHEDDIMVEFACDLINGLPNLQTLKMIPVEGGRRVPGVPPDVSKVVCSIKGNLQLQYVEFELFGSEIDEHFIESLLGCSPLLKKMVIGGCFRHNRVCCSFAKKWLKVIRASPIAEIHLYQA